MFTKMTLHRPAIRTAILLMLGLLFSSLSIAWDPGPDTPFPSFKEPSARKIVARPFTPPLPVTRQAEKIFPRPVKPTDGLIFAFCRWLDAGHRICRDARMPLSPFLAVHLALRNTFQAEGLCTKATAWLPWSCDRWYGLEMI